MAMQSSKIGTNQLDNDHGEMSISLYSAHTETSLKNLHRTDHARPPNFCKLLQCKLIS